LLSRKAEKTSAGTGTTVKLCKNAATKEEIKYLKIIEDRIMNGSIGEQMLDLFKDT